MFEDIVLKLLKTLGYQSVSRHALKPMSTLLEEKCKPIMPGKRDSLAVSLHRPKTAALAFDRVYGFPMMENSAPPEVRFFCGTEPEILTTAFSVVLLGIQEGILGDYTLDHEAHQIPDDAAEHERSSYQLLVRDLRREFGFEPTIFFENHSSQEAEFKPGPQEVLASSLANIEIVDEDRITWEQVLEFRRDKDARIKYRRLVRWIDAELRETGPGKIEDLILKRLEDYDWSLKKHGLLASLGTISALIDPKFLASASAAVASAAVAGGELWPALTAGSLIFGTAVATFGSVAIEGEDHRRKHNFEVAYVSELKKVRGR